MKPVVVSLLILFAVLCAQSVLAQRKASKTSSGRAAYGKMPLSKYNGQRKKNGKLPPRVSAKRAKRKAEARIRSSRKLV